MTCSIPHHCQEAGYTAPVCNCATPAPDRCALDGPASDTSALETPVLDGWLWTYVLWTHLLQPHPGISMVLHVRMLCHREGVSTLWTSVFSFGNQTCFRSHASSTTLPHSSRYPTCRLPFFFENWTCIRSHMSGCHVLERG